VSRRRIGVRVDLQLPGGISRIPGATPAHCEKAIKHVANSDGQVLNHDQHATALEIASLQELEPPDDEKTSS
jgi:hypothetical protein